MAELKNWGKEEHLYLKQGATLGRYKLTFTDQYSYPINISNYIFKSQIRKTSNSTIAASASFDIPVGTDGVVYWWYPATQTVNITADENSPLAPDSQYVWDMEMQLPNGDVESLLYGNVYVLREITKETP